MAVSKRARLVAAGGVLVLTGFGAGTAIALNGAASASDGGTAESARHGAGEEELTGDVADQVRAAVEEEYPDATVERLETDSDGVYEAHLTTADGERLVVAVDGDFQVTGAQEWAGRGGPHGRHGGHGPGGPGGLEEPLTGDTADQVTAAVKAEYPQATIVRVETDSEGVYEAHLVTASGRHLVVAVDEDFQITGSQEMPARGPHRHGDEGAEASDGSGTAGSGTAGSDADDTVAS